jgi:tetratricopeptide (TPR) repeat protein
MRFWIDRRVVWILDQFDCAWLCQRPIILPTSKFFPDPYRQTHEDLARLLRRTAGYMDLASEPLDLALFSDSNQVGWNTPLIGKKLAAGVYQDEGGVYKIWLESRFRNDPAAVVAVFAHELGHIHLLGKGRISEDEEDHEPLTDVLAALLGFGVFLAKALPTLKNYRYLNWEGWQITGAGYLSAPILGYVLGLFVWLRDNDDLQWTRYLPPDVRKYCKESHKWLRQLQPTSTEKPERILRQSTNNRQEEKFRLPSFWNPQKEDPLLEKQVEEAPEFDLSDDLFSRGIFLLQENKWLEAIDAFTKALRENPEDGECYEQRALACLEVGRLQEGFKDAEKAVELLPDDPQAYLTRGRCRYALQDFVSAETDFKFAVDGEKIANNDARLSEAWYYHGLANLGLKRGEAAVNDFTQAIRRDGSRSEFYVARAFAYKILGNAIDAQKDQAKAESLGWPHLSRPRMTIS